jgi:hypothetical protein
MPGLRNCFLDSVVCYFFWCVCVYLEHSNTAFL